MSPGTSKKSGLSLSAFWPLTSVWRTRKEVIRMTQQAQIPPAEVAAWKPRGTLPLATLGHKIQWYLPLSKVLDGVALHRRNPTLASGFGHNSQKSVCNQLIIEVRKCRRGDLNPHGTRSRQILSLLRMPISPLRRH